MDIDFALFRGKSDKSGAWVFGNLVTSGSFCYIVDFYNKKKPIVVKVISDTVSIYSGITDRYGNKIFSGDYVSVEFPGFYSVEEVVFCDGSFFTKDLSGKHRYLLSRFCSLDLFIFGNIFDTNDARGGIVNV